MPTGVGEPAANSTLFAKMNAAFGTTANWKAKFQSYFALWSQVANITYSEVTDDGLAMPSNAGRNTAPIRGDIRIGMHPIDGGFNILAYNYSPNSGDMILDADDTAFFNTSSSNFRRFRNTVMHEHGHGIGFAHVDPLDNTKLMEAFLNENFDGPQDDDIRGAQRNYGDPMENNDTAATAKSLGVVSGTRTILNLSTDASGDQDWFSIDNPTGTRLTVTVTPIGATYQEGPQGGATANINTKTINNLNIEVYAMNGTTLLGSSATQPAGTAEVLNKVPLTNSGGKTYIKILNAAAGVVDDVQRYTLAITTEDVIVSGVVNLQEAENKIVSITFIFRPLPNGTAFTRTATLSSLGNFTLNNIPPANYNVAVKGSKWLQKVVPNVNTTTNDYVGFIANLLAGDIEEDNSCDVIDLGAFIAAFGTVLGDANYDARADLTNDNSVDVLDFSLLVDNFGKLGDD